MYNIQRTIKSKNQNGFSVYDQRLFKIITHTPTRTLHFTLNEMFQMCLIRL